jgi:tRNA dimethylallyltransferase
MPILKRIVIVGPTASGKTDLALKAAKLLKGQIIAADSRTIYKDMDIGTAKPTAAERALIKHYCLDLVYPNQEFNVADFKKQAEQAQELIVKSGNVPIIVGGSGLYVDALVYEYTFVNTSQTDKEKYNKMTIEELTAALTKKNIALPVNYKNKLHLVNALLRQGRVGKKITQTPKGTIIVGLNPSKQVLKKRINDRAEQMIKQGVATEMELLLAKYGTMNKAYNGGIYKYLPQYLSAEINKEQLINLFVRSDLMLAKKQITWFKRNPDIAWFDEADPALEWVLKSK